MEEDLPRVYFEEADRPPSSYFQTNENKKPLKVVPFATPDPEEWLKAPEFVPRSRQLVQAFESVPGPAVDLGNFAPPFLPPFPPAPSLFSTMVQPSLPNPQPSIFPFNPLEQLTGIPAGYSANITNINQGNGPPIPAILLRKKRRRRKHNTNSMVHETSSNTHASSPCSSHPSDPNAFTDDDDSQGGNLPGPCLEIDELSGSCPDLSDEKLKKWDEYLYKAAVAHEESLNAVSYIDESTMHESVYETVPRSLLNVAEQALEGISSEEIRKIDKELNGNTAMTSSMVMDRLANYQLASDARTERTLAEEMGQLAFRPETTKYGYPKVDAPRVHLASIDTRDKKVKNTVIDREALKAYLDHQEDEFEEDFLEGINITVNRFDHCDDLTLSDVESAPTSRFEQIHRALKNTTNVELRAPERVCCVIS
ncbi:unnamed protein product [Caenorhabditis auriculariae]|uniref:Uncharacterized protein n=1 Tax=Caenorhabditis auriculariae TaxID=2777116 RepID=A0A8S1HXH5_9PELO|nr:unnamed protein product [Caenorhabditis auriculariae]